MPQVPAKATFDLPNDIDEGNLYPRDGQEFGGGDTYFDQPQERTEIEREETITAQETIPFLKQIHEWFDTQIADCNKLENIDLQSVTINGQTFQPPVSTDAQVLAFQMLHRMLIAKKNSFPSLQELEG